MINENLPVKILLVDDKPANLNVLEKLLESKDYELHKATSGKEALKLLLSNEYACCLLDIRMPEMDGFKTAEIIRQDPQHKYMPILFVTAEAADRESMFKGYETGAVDYVLKPLEPKIIRSKVAVFADLLRHRKALEKTQEVEELNNKLQKLNRELQSANDDLAHFTSMAAHNMNEPARKLRNLVDILIDELADSSESVKNLLDPINKSTSYILSLVNDFRALIGVDYRELTKSEVNLESVIKESLKWYEDELSNRKVKLEFDIFPETMCVYYSLAKRLYDNLIKNALDHVHTDEFILRFTSKKMDKGWVFGVYNTGSTIQSDKLSEIFMMYRQSDPEFQGGIGMGLTICKKIVDKHHGRIWAETSENSVHIQFTLEEQ